MTTYISLDLETWGKRAGCDLRSIGATVFHPYQIDAVIPPRNSPGQFYQVVDNPIVATHMHDIRTHREVWRNAMMNCMKLAGEQDQEGDCAYWQHEIIAFDRLFDLLDPIADCDPLLKYPELFRDPETVQWWSEQSAEAQAAFSNPIDLLDGLQLFAQWLAQVAPNPRDTVIYAHGSHFDIPILEAAFHAVGLEAPWFYRAPRDTRTLFDAAGIDDHSAYLSSFAQGDEIYHHALDDAIVQARAIAAALRKVTPFGKRQGAWYELKQRLIGAEAFDLEYRHVSIS